MLYAGCAGQSLSLSHHIEAVCLDTSRKVRDASRFVTGAVGYDDVMHCSTTLAVLLAVTACDAHITGAPPNAPADAASTQADSPDGALVDASIPTTDAPIALGPWSTPGKLAPALDPTKGEDDVALSANLLEMFFAIDSASGKDLFYSARASVTDSFPQAMRLPFNDATSDETPRLADNDTTLYFASGRGTSGSLDIYRVKRSAAGSTDWGTVDPVNPVNTGDTEKWFAPCGNDRYVMVRGPVNGTTDLFEGTLGGSAIRLTAISSAQDEIGTFLTPDCLTLYFASSRPTLATPNGGKMNIYRTTRTAVGAAWAEPALVDDFAQIGGNQEDPWVSSDDRTFLFVSDAGGTKDVYQATR
jgi:hypothetical protein